MMRQKEKQDTKTNFGFLEPEYETEGLIDNEETALSMILESGISVPCPQKPYCNVRNWRRVIDMLSESAVAEVASGLERHHMSQAFKTLSIKVDSDIPYRVEEILNIKLDDGVSDDERQHVEEVFLHCIEQLPPVTAALVGGFLSEVKVFERDTYYNEVLPDGKRYGGLHRPHRRCIEITEGCSCRVNVEPDDYPSRNSSFSCMFIHELGHTVHNVYGFLRPGDYGYDYPSKDDEIESTGCISPLSLSDEQSKFVYDMFRTYVYNHMDCYENIRYNNYGNQHPTEAFACAFEILLRNGEQKLVDDYHHFHDVFTHLV